MHKFLIFFLFSILGISLYAQEYSELKEIEDSLLNLSKIIFDDTEHDFKKYEANELFKDLLYEALREEHNFDFRFAGIPLLSVQGPADKSFRVFSWYIKNNMGEYEYFGFFQTYNTYRKRYEIHEMYDKTEEIGNASTSLLTTDNWYGCIYYNVIVQKRKRRTFYILFGWKPINSLEHQKVIEVITLKSKGVPRFGYPLFQKPKSKDKRVILRYSSKASCLLRYENQSVQYRKKRVIPLPKRISKSPKFKEVSKKQKMIILDRLVPENPALVNQIQFYIPSGDVFDAYYFERGKFRFRENIDARNPEIPKRQRKIPHDREKGLFDPKG